MYLRIIKLLVKEGEEASFATFYRERVLKTLNVTDGCLFAALLEPWRGEGYRSLTLWRTAEDAHRYEERGIYHALLRQAEPMLSKRTEWRLRLASDPLETADLARREIPSEGYELESVADDGDKLREGQRGAFVRIVSIRVDPGRVAEFEATWAKEAMPSMRAQEGCRGALLGASSDGAGRMLSISIWDREQDAMRYEMSGEFERVTEALKGTFSALYDWGVTLGAGRDTRAEAPEVSTYQIVMGRKLEPS
jgi:heme-degrading monooxygenase HmoA